MSPLIRVYWLVESLQGIGVERHTATGPGVQLRLRDDSLRKRLDLRLREVGPAGWTIVACGHGEQRDCVGDIRLL